MTRRSDLAYVAFTLGGSAYISRADIAAGGPLRAFTKAGKPRNRRGSDLPLYVCTALIHPAYKVETL